MGKDMSQITEEDMGEIRSAVEKKFPDDPALQQIHIARKIIAKEAELEGVSFLQYVRRRGKQIRHASSG